MIEPPIPDDEAERLAALKSYQILDTAPEPDFDDYTHLASYICNVPIALISLLDETQQWFKSKVGITAESTPREISFCGHAILQSEIFEINNALTDERFFDNPLVTGDPNIRFYAGAHIITPDGYKLGTLCVIDTEPRQLNPAQREALMRLSRQVMVRIQMHANNKNVLKLNQQLTQKSTFIKKVTDNIPISISYLDQDLRCQFANSVYQNLHNQPSEKIKNKKLIEYIQPNIYEFIHPYALKALAGEKQEFVIDDKICEEGRMAVANYIPDFNNAGEVIGFYSLISDITDQKQLAEKQQLAANVLAQANDGILITDANHRIVLANPAFYNMTQYTQEEVIGKLPSFLNYESNDYEIYKAILHDLETQFYWAGEIRIKRKDGEVAYTSLSVSCIYDEHCNVINHMSIYMDRTVKVNQKTELERLTGMLNRTGEIAKVGGWEYDIIKRKLNYSNQLFNLLEANPYLEIAIDAVINFVVPEYQQMMLEVTEACFLHGTPWSLEIPFITAKGKHIWLHTTGERLVEDRVTTKLVGSVQDITPRKQYEMQREKDEIAHKKALIREVHHRIKNNLMGITNLLRNYSMFNPAITSPINAAIAQIQSVAVIHGLQGQNQETTVEVSALLSSIVESMSNLWQAAIFIHRDEYQTPYFLIESECVPIALIFNELVSNAIKHRRDASKVIVKIHQSRDQEQVQVKISNLVDQAQNFNTELSKGTGLTLADSLMPKKGFRLSLQRNYDSVEANVFITKPILALN